MPAASSSTSSSTSSSALRAVVWTRRTHLVGTLRLEAGADERVPRPGTVPKGWHHEQIGGNGRLLWRTGSALKTILVAVRARFVGGNGVLAIVIGAANEWRSCGSFRLELAADGRRAAFWDNGERRFPLFSGGSAAGAGAEVRLRLTDAPPFSYAMAENRVDLAAGSYATALPFRPYAVIPDEIAIEVSGASVEIEELSVRIGAARAPIVAFGDSQIHGGRVLEALAVRGMPPAVNAGRAGGSAVGALGRLESDLLRLQPRHALLWLGSNDLEYSRRRSGDARSGLEATVSNVETVLTAARDAVASVHLVGSLPRGMVEVRELNQRLGDLAARTGATFYDPYEVLHRRNDKLDIRYSDGLHPNDEGATKLAEWFVEQGLVESLKS